MGKKRADKNNRKQFLKQLGGVSMAAMGAPFILGKGRSGIRTLKRDMHGGRKHSANDRVQYALIGAGGMGQGGMNTALDYYGFRMVAACDLYESRLTRCRERFGEDLFTTMDYREILDRDDVDAVLIATSDHWHDKITIDAIRAGKAVYVEKPITQTVEQAYPVLEAARDAAAPVMVGSQRTSNIIYEKAKELYEAGEIGELNFVEGYWDRFSAMGAWQYSIPPSASEENVAWETFRKDLPMIPFDAKHFFRWRNYDDYGTGVSGDLFVHLFSGLHMILESNGPRNIFATGGLRYWHDGRDAEDVVLGLFDYDETGSHPAFNLALRVNFVDGSGGGSRIRLVGSEGEMDLSARNLVVRRRRMATAPGMSIGDFSEETRREYEEYYEQKYPEERASVIEPNELEYRVPDGYSDVYDHHVNFYKSIREGRPVLQDAEFGLRAAGPAVLSATSLREKRIIDWDPDRMRVI